MNTKFKQLALGFLLLFSSLSFSQIQRMERAKIGGSSPMNNSAALEIESTSQGMLVPRMISTERDAISSPANGLLIFNTTNNGFEVYKNSCMCWVAISDGGNMPASNLVNTAPTATTLNYSGAFLVGQTVTISYLYNDLQSDVEGATGIQWQRATSNAGAGLSNIVGATNTTYTLAPEDAGLFLRAVVTPRASTGVLNGVSVFGSYTQAELATTPSATSTVVTGSPAQGSTLTGSYTYTGGSGVESTNPASPSLYNWQTATSADGTNIATANLYGNAAFGTTYVPQADILGRFIRFGVRARDANGLQAVNFVYSPWVGPITTATEVVPVVSNVTYSPNPGFGLTLTGSYVYFDANADPESGTTYQWYTATDATGTGQTSIAGATGTTYVPTNANSGLFIGFGVTPKAATGNTTFGTQAIHYATAASIGAAAFTFTGNSNYLPYFSQARIMDVSNSLLVEINVTTVGAAVFSTPVVNGYSFSLNAILTTTGVQWVTLTASGIQSAYNATGDNFTITGAGTTTTTQAVTIVNSMLGAGFTSHSNGTEVFSNNTACQTKIISAIHTPATCSGTLTVGSNIYNLVLINGQCWMRDNLKEAPSAPCVNAINTGCNIWTNSSPGDIGSWGYFNNTILTGSAGWSTTEPVANYGLLYQWSAAMNGSTTERAKGVCPTGWHIPSDCEFMFLEHGLGMTIADQNIGNGWRNSGNVGGQLATFARSTPAAANGTGSNSTLFTLLSVGQRSSAGVFGSYGTNISLHTSTISSSSMISRLIDRAYSGVSRGTADSRGNGRSVRCLKD